MTETYVYDGDGERISRTSAGVTTVYIQGLWEETTAGAVKQYYSLHGATVAVRDSGSGVAYLHADHLGSVSVASGAGATLLSRQAFGPWGSVTSGGVSQTARNFTGQRLDSGTGLLYYHARYYDPVLARFVSADSVVPSSASGSLDGVQLKGLTADFHEPGFVATLNDENALGFWFQLSDDDRQQAGLPWGPANPQALNRYSYVLNAPVRWTDPSGHTYACTVHACGMPSSGGNVRGGGIVVGGAAAIVAATVAGQELGAHLDATTPQQSKESKEFLDHHDPQSWEGKDSQEIEDMIPDDWVKSPAHKGGGTKYSNPGRPGEQVLVEPGWPDAVDPVHGGPYVKVSQGGKVTRIPLKGNPALGTP